MARLIDADELLKQAIPWTVECGEYLGEDVREINVVTVSQIERAPTIDAMKVVRCMDCKHWNVSTDKTMTWCSRLRSVETIEYDFCSYGERRDAE